MNLTVVFKVNASAEVGFGHFRRCLSLAEILKKNSFRVLLHTNPNNPFLKGESEKTFFKIDQTSDSSAESLLQFAENNQARWVVLDGYEYDEDYEKSIMSKGLKLFRIVDLPSRKYHCDVLLSQNFGAENESYQVSEGARLALGLDFLLLSSNIRNAVGLNKPDSNSFNILITLGGSKHVDQELVDLFAQAMRTLPVDSLQVTWIGSKESVTQLESQIHPSNVLIKCFEFTSKIEDYLLNCDMAVCSVGTTMWELIYLEIPFVAMPLTDEQAGYANRLVAASLCKSLKGLGALKFEDIAEQILSMRLNLDERNRIRARQKAVLNREHFESRILGLFN